MTPDGPRLIEVNINAGGAFLNTVLARAQLACCGGSVAAAADPAETFGAKIAAMFMAEWRRQRSSGPLRRIASLFVAG